ncbi:protein phosphatase 2C domain-containing protein [Alcanivorax sp. S6407]|uniref:PP2C family protein-serine/threonine phosphatase n=1 Tax=Alcanivorax sp. S6407 TaxID=2926424 RepID=UPI001FF39E92|nr:protein phosphatase 2C domain-containing protein [Alcanivorax sp. S6407]MCK0154932.1 protein phosphatase 2C domain-containing protein [Alcanivorax sp. S6407]
MSHWLRPFSRPPLHWQANAETQTGPNKAGNEDSVSIGPGVAILCDGVGGHGNGDIASRLACDFLLEALSGNQDTALEAHPLKQHLRRCHQHLLNYMEEHPRTNSMATTVVLALQQGNHCWLAWVGDSRAYLLRKGKLAQLSHDHSFVNEKVAQGVLSQEDAEQHPMAHLITSSLGGTPNSPRHIGIQQIPLRRKDRLILCSDGVYAYMSPEQFQQAAAKSAQALVQQAIDNNTADNASAICINFE